MYCGSLQCKTYDITERTDEQGIVHRRIDCKPKLDLPAPVLKLIGDGSFVESGRFDPSNRRYVAEYKPNMGSDKIKANFEISVEPLDGKRCVRVQSIENTIKIFAFASLAEKIFEQVQRKLHADTAEFTNRWIRERGL
jgi:hypothetical protein